MSTDIRRTKRAAARTAAVCAAGALAVAAAACEPGPTEPPPVADPEAGAARTAAADAPAAPASPAPAPRAAAPGETGRDDAAAGWAAAEGASPDAVAMLEPTAGHTATGTVAFTARSDGGVAIIARLDGLDPGPHGFHIHENGDCSADDASSAGDHFAPDGDPHGAPDVAAGSHHAGDFGNVSASAEGIVEAMLIDEELTLSGRYGVIERAVVVHAGEDDLTTQPDGAAGEPVACGVIRAAGDDGTEAESSGARSPV